MGPRALCPAESNKWDMFHHVKMSRACNAMNNLMTKADRKVAQVLLPVNGATSFEPSGTARSGCATAMVFREADWLAGAWLNRRVALTLRQPWD